MEIKKKMEASDYRTVKMLTKETHRCLYVFKNY